MNRRQTFQLIAGATAATGAAMGAGPVTRAFAQQKPPVFSLPPLGYAYEALEPHIDAATMGYHHKNHHNAFIGVLNAQVEKFPDLATKPIETFLSNLAAVPEAVRTPVRNAGGGHWNHTWFWELMTPGGAKAPAFRVFLGIHEIGIAFAKTSEKGNPYLSVLIDDPSFATPIWANLLTNSKDATIPLMWDRSKPKA